jgi:transcriptional regulator with XRE-family HTH domain
MDSKAVVADLLARSGLSKSALSARSGVSRSLIDDYLKGRSQPSLAQLRRLASAAGLRLDVSVTPAPTIPADFVAVLEFGDLFPRKAPRPLVDMRDVWRRTPEPA